MNVTKMKLGLCLAMMGFCPSIFAQNAFQIKGKVDGMTADSVVLFKIVNSKKQLWQKTTMANGEFTFNGTVDAPELCLICLGANKSSLTPFFVDKGTTTYSCKLYKDKNRPSVLTIEGNLSQNQLNAYEKDVQALYDSMSKLSLKTKKEKEKMTADQKAQVDIKMDSIFDAMDDAFRKQSIITYANSVVSPYIVKSEFLHKKSSAELKEYINLYSDEVKKTAIAREIIEHINRLEKVDLGSEFPNIKLKTLDGKDFELASLKGKVFIIDFWASWCGPCRRENPNMVKLYNEFHPKGLEIVGISLDKSYDPWKAAVEKDGLTWTQISDLKYWQSEAVNLYVISSAPYTILIDKDGKIAARRLRGEELRKAVENLLSK